MSSPAAVVRIRHMNAADLGSVVEIAARLAEAPHWPVSAYLKAIDPDNTPRRIALVATDAEDDSPAGFLVASLLGPEAELETIAVAAQGQRRGVGARLLNALTEELRTGLVSRLILEVRASNLAALGFYRAHGFEEMGRRPRYYTDPEEDAVLMGLRLV
jgi:[ribosomal protein S18]-alanine N-acetyltransferase